MHGNRSSRSTGDRKTQLLCAAKLISAFGARHPSNEIYQMALNCYELLVDVLEDPSVARELSAFVQMPGKEIQASAEAIIDRLLFNQKDPHMSLGLQEHASAAEVTRRWKRLIILYHPDRYPNQMKYEERAKKINQAYAEIQRMKERGVHSAVAKNIRTPSFPKTKRIHYSKYMKRLPTVIITVAILLAIISIVLFIIKIKRIHSVAYLERETGSVTYAVGIVRSGNL